MIVDECHERKLVVAERVAAADCEVVAVIHADDDLLEKIEHFQPDVILIDLDAPGRDSLESLRSVQATHPRPMVMFSQDGDSETIRQAVEAGVSAYVVDGIQSKRVRPILDAAVARFRQFRALEKELDRTRNQLADRKRIERAKGILMNQRKVSEEEAYQLLRKSAMNRNQKLVDVADNIIAAVELLQVDGV
jgi:response regulator NasT